MDESARQQALLAAICERDDGLALVAHLGHRPAGVQRGLQAYQANAGASASRALGAAFPTVKALVGDESFSMLARAHWRDCPPERGDLGLWGERLPGWIDADAQLAGVPYLADMARLDWQVAQAERAADARPEVDTLSCLAGHDPAHLRIDLLPGVAVVASMFPIVTIWGAHQHEGEAPWQWQEAQRALDARQGEHALVWRQGWRARVAAVDAATARWTTSLLQGCALDEALLAAGEGFDLAAWLHDAVRHGRVWRVRLRAAA